MRVIENHHVRGWGSMTSAPAAPLLEQDDGSSGSAASPRLLGQRFIGILLASASAVSAVTAAGGYLRARALVRDYESVHGKISASSTVDYLSTEYQTLSDQVVSVAGFYGVLGMWWFPFLWLTWCAGLMLALFDVVPGRVLLAVLTASAALCFYFMVAPDVNTVMTVLE